MTQISPTSPTLSERAARAETRGAPALPPVRRYLYRGLGTALVGLGTLGIFLPLLPTTIFWILAAFCYARGAPDLQRRLFAHKRFGEPIELFVSYRVIERSSKMAAIGGISLSFALTALLAGMPDRVLYGLGFLLALISLYLATRPETVPPGGRR
ncbi:MAG: YbaN family protein [Alphaproteobacteria bacterium]